ncbi:MAG: hypothetical protein AAF615_06195 [Pseudomonadota bacterium]
MVGPLPKSTLVTGFGPFPGVPENPSGTLVDVIGALELPGVVTQHLETTWAAETEIKGFAGEFQSVVMFGVAARSRRIRYERLAHAGATPAADSNGTLPENPPYRSRWTQLPVRELARDARAAGFDVAVSHSPGHYICNAALSGALAVQPLALFVHIPMPTGSGKLHCGQLTDHAVWLIRRLQGV